MRINRTEGRVGVWTSQIRVRPLGAKIATGNSLVVYGTPYIDYLLGKNFRAQAVPTNIRPWRTGEP